MYYTIAIVPIIPEAFVEGDTVDRYLLRINDTIRDEVVVHMPVYSRQEGIRTAIQKILYYLDYYDGPFVSIRTELDNLPPYKWQSARIIFESTERELFVSISTSEKAAHWQADKSFNQIEPVVSFAEGVQSAIDFMLTTLKDVYAA